MNLKYIEIQGFKSFAQKTRLEFHPGITAIVGPNGCGKSNIADAIRWTLGEQSARSLRGTKMEDIIFGGTSNRRAVGMAEVTLVLENDNENADGANFSELSVARRVYRSGESEYLINGAKCRLKDIHELFMDTGLGREGYSIISQGRIEEILSTRKDDRREFFEEATGIVKYKARKQSAEQKLENQRANLERIDDIIEELSALRQPLEIQAAKAREFLKLAEQRKSYKINIYLSETEALGKEAERNKINIDNIVFQISETERELELSENDINQKKAEIENQTQSLEESRENAANLALEQKKNENEIALAEQNLNHGRKDSERCHADLARHESDLENYTKNIEEKNQEHTDAKKELDAKCIALETAQAEFEETESRLANVRGGIESMEKEYFSKKEERRVADSETDRLNMSLERNNNRLAEILNIMENIFKSNEETESAWKVTKNKLEKINLEISQRTDINNKLGITLENLEITTKNLSEKLEKLKAQIADRRGRRDAISEMADNFEGYNFAVREIFRRKAMQSAPIGFEGIYGTVASLIRVDLDYETAIEVALGSSSQNIITNNEETAKIAIEFLKKTKAGRATFLPINTVKPRQLADYEMSVLDESGILGTALDFVECAAVYKGVLSNLLGRVLLCDTLENAINFSKKRRFSYQIVTLEGEIINTGGSISGGSRSKGSNLLGRGREISELGEMLKRLNQEISELEGDWELEKSEMVKISTKIEANRELIQKLELKRAQLSNESEQSKNKITENNKSLQILNSEKEEIQKEIESKQDTIIAISTQKSELDVAISLIDQNLESSRRVINDDAKIKEILSKNITELKIDIATLKVRVETLADGAKRMSDGVLVCKNRINALLDEIKLLEKTQNDIKIKIENHSQKLEEILQNRKNLESEIGKKIEKRGILLEKLSEKKNFLLEDSKKLNRLKLESVRLKSISERIEENRQRHDNEIWEEYNLTQHDIINNEKLQIGLSELRRREKDLRERIRELGNVNLGAIDEFAALKGRLEYLVEQREDIKDAEMKILEIIDELNRLITEQFATQFKQISENFGRVFVEIFGGGNAYLKISDENDILESGIEIFASPPGKSLQNMSLLSGGERALCAIALLFAILWQRPSPFCVLDEIEASLDDGNIQRFTKYLQNLKGFSQFIIITHRKGTMEIADTLFGVTMEEKGVSKVVGVKF
ncbi:MAG: chromosome segregation protein SMC [Defluviitaleaceae bacterium]|nr:chromosome segregation protein SMC [Defluviitaleaceae bacterium]